MSIKGCSRDAEGRKGEGGGEEVKTVVCDKVECERWCVTKKDGVKDGNIYIYIYNPP